MSSFFPTRAMQGSVKENIFVYLRSASLKMLRFRDEWLYHWWWTFCTEIAWRCMQMRWFICGRVPFVNWHETSCSSAISHVVVAIGGTLVRLRGRVREGDGWAGKLNRVLLKQWVCVLIFSFDRNCHIWVCQMILSCCNLERASEYELKLTSTETLDFQMGVNLCPDHSQFDQSTELRSTALQKLNGYICIHLGWAESLTQPCSCSKEQLNCGTNYTRNFDRDVHRDLTSTLLRFHRGE